MDDLVFDFADALREWVDEMVMADAASGIMDGLFFDRILPALEKKKDYEDAEFNYDVTAILGSGAKQAAFTFEVWDARKRDHGPRPFLLSHHCKWPPPPQKFRFTISVTLEGEFSAPPR